MMGKVVSEAFKETHSAEWKAQHPSRGDVVSDIIRDLGSEARWDKAVQTRRDSGDLLDAVQDIGPLIGLVQKDVHDEQGDEIGRRLFKYFWKDIRRGLSDGLPQWYKARLALDSPPLLRPIPMCKCEGHTHRVDPNALTATAQNWCGDCKCNNIPRLEGEPESDGEVELGGTVTGRLDCKGSNFSNLLAKGCH